MAEELRVAGVEIDQLQLALANRLAIGQAQGILMERLDMSAEQAISYLKRASMRLNSKVGVVAAAIALTRKLPDLD